MSDDELDRIVKLFGAPYVCRLPDVGHGAAAAGLYGRFYDKRMQELRQKEVPPQVKALVNELLEIAIDAKTRNALQAIAEQASTPNKPLDMGKVAAAVLQNAVGKINVSATDFGQIIAELQNLPTQAS